MHNVEKRECIVWWNLFPRLLVCSHILFIFSLIYVYLTSDNLLYHDMKRARRSFFLRIIYKMSCRFDVECQITIDKPLVLLLWCSGLNCCPWCQHLIWAPIWALAAHLQSSCLWMCLENQQRMTQVLGPPSVTHVGDLHGVSEINLCHCNLLKNKAVDSKYLSLPVLTLPPPHALPSH